MASRGPMGATACLMSLCTSSTHRKTSGARLLFLRGLLMTARGLNSGLLCTLGVPALDTHPHRSPASVGCFYMHPAARQGGHALAMLLPCSCQLGCFFHGGHIRVGIVRSLGAECGGMLRSSMRPREARALGKRPPSSSLTRRDLALRCSQRALHRGISKKRPVTWFWAVARGRAYHHQSAISPLPAYGHRSDRAVGPGAGAPPVLVVVARENHDPESWAFLVQ